MKVTMVQILGGVHTYTITLRVEEKNGINRINRDSRKSMVIG